MSTQRLFIGIPCEPEARVKAVLDELGCASGASAVPVRNLHITLKFLGITPAERLRSIVDMLNGEATTRRFTLQLHGTGSFRTALWLGVAPSAGLEALAHRISQAAATLGFEPEARAYVPHLTVARLKGDAFDRHAWEARYATMDWQRLTVERISLFRSDTRAEGALYTELAGVPLA